MKQKILDILQHYTQDMEADYYSANFGVPEYSFDDIADKILELFEDSLKSQEIIKLSNDVDFNKNY